MEGLPLGEVEIAYELGVDADQTAQQDQEEAQVEKGEGNGGQPVFHPVKPLCVTKNGVAALFQGAEQRVVADVVRQRVAILEGVPRCRRWINNAVRCQGDSLLDERQPLPHDEREIYEEEEPQCHRHRRGVNRGESDGIEKCHQVRRTLLPFQVDRLQKPFLRHP